MTPEDYFNKYQYLVDKTIYRMFIDPYGVCRQHRMEMDDLKQYGLEGLFKGCLSYKINKGTHITTHLINNIRWNICEKLKREGFIKYDSNKYNSIEKFNLLSIDNNVPNDKNEPTLDTYHDLIPCKNVHVEEEAISEIKINKLLSELTKKQIEFIKLKAQGYSSGDIGKMYKCTASNVKWHLYQVKNKLKHLREVI
ncbi:sigma-70 family RNA polymerase sigma factor [Neobacillus sp. YIM B02564]|uniref:Sigma-70 family RNA polymerase sigma factor n=1 Tax=Neobacillus paridis TaxID=2803862 RepID=A0ABS1TIG9_9BACI|nr:sigma-70 family RNA polymerase sigma factor [Neobacillus paridis]MBL4951113.1 sigma-70 family RNA polymerase sigma factor [Neobacillus paridis]